MTRRGLRFPAALIAALAVLTLAKIGLPETASAATLQTTYNWAGAVARTTTAQSPFTGSDITYQVPSVNCRPKENSTVAVWTGIGGWSAGNTLYQIGTNSQCVKGTPTYNAWFELEANPKGQQQINFNGQKLLPEAVQPGDWIIADVTVEPADSGSGYITHFDIYDYSSPVFDGFNLRWHNGFNLPYISNRLTTRSSECVVERPQISKTNTNFAVLANFGTVAMTCSAYTGINLVSRSILDEKADSAVSGSASWNTSLLGMKNSRNQILATVDQNNIDQFGLRQVSVTWLKAQ